MKQESPRGKAVMMLLSEPAAPVFLAGIIMLIIAIMVILVPGGDIADQEKQVSLYCEMVEEFKQSNGEYGWPAYKGESQCER